MPHYSVRVNTVLVLEIGDIFPSLWVIIQVTNREAQPRMRGGSPHPSHYHPPWQLQRPAEDRFPVTIVTRTRQGCQGSVQGLAGARGSWAVGPGVGARGAWVRPPNSLSASLPASESLSICFLWVIVWVTGGGTWRRLYTLLPWCCARHPLTVLHSHHAPASLCLQPSLQLWLFSTVPLLGQCPSQSKLLAFTAVPVSLSWSASQWQRQWLQLLPGTWLLSDPEPTTGK